MIKSIKKNQTKKIAEIFNIYTDCTIYNLNNNFQGAYCPIDRAKSRYEILKGKMSLNTDKDIVTIELSSNCWYELKKPNHVSN